jgi:hypothetical protein
VDVLTFIEGLNLFDILVVFFVAASSSGHIQEPWPGSGWQSPCSPCSSR